MKKIVPAPYIDQTARWVNGCESISSVMLLQAVGIPIDPDVFIERDLPHAPYWEQEGRLSAVVTQNIDGLHQKAGSRRVYELHGSILRNYCTRCGKFCLASFVKNCDGIPRCSCGGIVKPDVVLYEEGLDEKTVEGALEAISTADMLLVAGTSLTVYPAAGFLRYYRGNRLVLINRDPTPFDDRADLVFHESLGKVLGALENL